MTTLEADTYIHDQLAALGVRVHVTLGETATELAREGCDDIIAFAVALYEENKK